MNRINLSIDTYNDINDIVRKIGTRHGNNCSIYGRKTTIDSHACLTGLGSEINDVYTYNRVKYFYYILPLSPGMPSNYVDYIKNLFKNFNINYGIIYVSESVRIPTYIFKIESIPEMKKYFYGGVYLFCTLLRFVSLEFLLKYYDKENILRKMFSEDPRYVIGYFSYKTRLHNFNDDLSETLKNEFLELFMNEKNITDKEVLSLSRGIIHNDFDIIDTYINTIKKVFSMQKFLTKEVEYKLGLGYSMFARQTRIYNVIKKIMEKGI